ncbi:MAG: non-ribosomal peptide synthetase, partial [bacterium]|nr:non-ribosomal peptide synthetase [bacterium]
SMPLTPNGKVDRGALGRRPVPQGVGPEQTATPRTPTEEVVAGIWCEVVAVDRVGIGDNFFDLGGHSLLATQVISRVREAFGVEIALHAMFDAPTVAELAAAIEQQRGAEQAITPIGPAPRDAVALSFAQERMWFLQQLDPAATAYHLPVAVRLSGAIEVAVLARALDEVTRRHEVLRTHLVPVSGRPRPVIADAFSAPLPLADLRSLEGPAREAETRRLANREAQLPFDLSTGPLLRATLLRLEGQEWVVLVTMHHIVTDGWSVEVLIHELTVLCQAFSQRRPSPLDALPVQYADYAHWQRQWLRGEVLERQLAYWREQLAAAPAVLELPADRPRPLHQSFRGHLLPMTLDEELTADLTALSRRQHATLFMSLLAAFATLLGRYSGQSDLVVGSPIASRNHRQIEGLIGFFVNTLALRVQPAPSRTFRQLLDAVRRTALDAYAHQDLPFERLVEELQPQRDAGANPLFQVMLVLQNLSWRRRELPEVTFSPLPLGGTTA